MVPMASDWVVEHFNVVEDVLPSLITVFIGLPLYLLALEQLKEAFGNSVVVAVATTAHATN